MGNFYDCLILVKTGERGEVRGYYYGPDAIDMVIEEVVKNKQSGDEKCLAWGFERRQR